MKWRYWKKKKKQETKLNANVLKYDPNTQKTFFLRKEKREKTKTKNADFNSTTQNMRSFQGKPQFQTNRQIKEDEWK